MVQVKAITSMYPGDAVYEKPEYSGCGRLKTRLSDHAGSPSPCLPGWFVPWDLTPVWWTP